MFQREHNNEHLVSKHRNSRLYALVFMMLLIIGGFVLRTKLMQDSKDGQVIKHEHDHLSKEGQVEVVEFSTEELPLNFQLEMLDKNSVSLKNIDKLPNSEGEISYDFMALADKYEPEQAEEEYEQGSEFDEHMSAFMKGNRNNQRQGIQVGTTIYDSNPIGIIKHMFEGLQALDTSLENTLSMSKFLNCLPSHLVLGDRETLEQIRHLMRQVSHKLNPDQGKRKQVKYEYDNSEIREDEYSVNSDSESSKALPSSPTRNILQVPKEEVPFFTEKVPFWLKWRSNLKLPNLSLVGVSNAIMRQYVAQKTLSLKDKREGLDDLPPSVVSLRELLYWYQVKFSEYDLFFGDCGSREEGRLFRVDINSKYLHNPLVPFLSKIFLSPYTNITIVLGDPFQMLINDYLDELCEADCLKGDQDYMMASQEILKRIKNDTSHISKCLRSVSINATLNVNGSDFLFTKTSVKCLFPEDIITSDYLSTENLKKMLNVDVIRKCLHASLIRLWTFYFNSNHITLFYISSNEAYNQKLLHHFSSSFGIDFSGYEFGLKNLNSMKQSLYDTLSSSEIPQVKSALNEARKVFCELFKAQMEELAIILTNQVRFNVVKEESSTRNVGC
jgi:hypothetical protein